jgi:hypothetical protein
MKENKTKKGVLKQFELFGEFSSDLLKQFMLSNGLHTEKILHLRIKLIFSYECTSGFKVYQRTRVGIGRR